MTQNNPRILANIITSISQTKSKEDVLYQLNKVDQQQPINLCRMFQLYGRNYNPPSYSIQLQKTNKNSLSLGIPKANSLTDSLLKNTFGCQEKLAKSYLQILDQTAAIEEEEKKKRIQEAKNAFATANNFKDFCANSKPYMNKSNLSINRPLPVVDNEHDSYLKTQLMFLDKPQNIKPNEKQYFDKHLDVVTKKLNEIGGMEDTIKNMEESLQRNQLKNVKKRGVMNSFRTTNTNLSSKYPTRKSSTNSNWIEKSKVMRKQFMDKFNFQ